jgi:hypothetical protein
MRKVLVVLAVLSVAGAGIFIAVRTADRDSSASRRTRDTTTSTSAFGAGRASTTTISAPSTTTTISAPSTTTTISATSSTVPGAITTVSSPSTTTTSPGGSVPDCGRGAARAEGGVTKVENAYEVTATVRNEADRAIEIDTLVVRVTYPGPRMANYPSDATKFAGTRIEPGQAVKFAIRESRATEAPTSFEVAEFSYHTVDLPQCKSS